jgi:hypothetical protein
MKIEARPGNGFQCLASSGFESPWGRHFKPAANDGRRGKVEKDLVCLSALEVSNNAER